MVHGDIVELGLDECPSERVLGGCLLSLVALFTFRVTILDLALSTVGGHFLEFSHRNFYRMVVIFILIVRNGIAVSIIEVFTWLFEVSLGVGRLFLH